MRLTATVVMALALAGGVASAWLVVHAQREPTVVLPDAGRYYGPLIDGLLEGEGRLEWPTGARYEGEFQGGLMHGQGRYRYADGAVYEGMFEHGMVSGYGRLTTADGRVYEGRFERETFVGPGTYSDESGLRYEGEFRDWQFHGMGKLTDPAGNVYEGRFEYDEPVGEVRFQGVDGSSYEGGMLRWRFHGQGRLTLPSGDRYEGKFAYGRYHGQGSMQYADGRAAEVGEWEYGEFVEHARLSAREAAEKVERALYAQHALLQRQLGGLLESDPERIDLYLLAIAGDGTQEVFRREVEFVRNQFDRDYGTAGRSVVLANSRSRVDELPLATRTSIAAALRALGERMDREQDILFVFLTSHGSATHEFLLAQEGMELPALEASALAEMIRAAGVRWKVIVVSACYSGGFIEPLRDDYTMVITAARHDRTSFGCADENEFTYFGRAFFEQALPQSASFTDAFEKAAALVRTWEAELDGAQPSLPQIHSPAAIVEHLTRWRAQSLRAR